MLIGHNALPAVDSIITGKAANHNWNVSLNAVFKGDDGFFRIKMDEMFYAIINAIKELDAKVTYLMNREKRINDLEKRVEILEKSIKK